MFGDLYFTDLVVVYLVLCWPRFTVLFVIFSPGFDFDSQ